MDLGPLDDRIDLATGASISADLAAARMSAVFGRCVHADAVPVELLDGGDLVAWLCPDCGTQLPVDWRERPAVDDPATPRSLP